MFAELLFLLLLILFNAFFAASEIALISLNDNKIKMMAEEGHKKARLLTRLLNEPGRFLATIQVGVTLAGFLASAFAAKNFAEPLINLLIAARVPVSETWLEGISVISITLVLSYFSLVLGELVPKRLAMQNAERISMSVAWPLNTLSVIAHPFVKLLTTSTNFFIRLLGFDPYAEEANVTEEEIRLMVDVGKEKGVIDQIEKEMINNIFEFDNKLVSEIMTHRTDITGIPLSSALSGVLKLISIEQYTRFPVFEDDLDNIVGVLHIKDLIRFLGSNEQRNHFSLKSIMRPPYFVPISKKTDELFKELQKNRTHMAVVIDEHGGTAGIVTIEDLIEEVMGNIFDEYDDEEPDIEELDRNTFIIKGSVSLGAIKDYFDIELPTDDYDTLSGFIIGQVDRIPDEKETLEVEYSGMVFKVEKVEGKRISKVKVCRA
ncbi:MAG: Magnesium and cobalt efflux protein CorC [Syntrophomonadaceae bacterium]|nr:Magnesium and cobalt efflux protein CorC [Bacillota bacterium]